ncbi:ras and EF-hand domain-containing protein homolog isoform X2 [Stylophora pistillata]|uniref:ras and EF-hand domain-containing protein homolog isoform X2 n=1 Tax=Stylophora pistillata TaxID=50429 RepID=UPI000C04BBFF|nr:ras and EF-hand domain-containing protein homolog isoform X2 [Stylophora pistillata]
MDSEVNDDIEHTVKDIFRSWDLNKSGFIEKPELACCCAELNLTKLEIEDLFNELDVDKDNKISLLDFSKGFKRVCSLFEADVEELSIAEKERKKFDKLLDALGVRELLSGQEYVSDLFHCLHNSSESPQLIALLESFLFSVVRDVKHYSSENQRLEEALKRTCEKHSEHMDQLDNELEQQMQRLESRIRKEEKSKQERSNLDIVWQLENKNKEIQTLTARVQKLEGKLKRKEPEEQKIKEEVDDKVQEIRYLQSQLTDAQTNLAVLRSELAQLRNDYEEQESQLTAEKRTVLECVQEQESLTRQLQLLHEANKKLHDTNDDLRAALETRKNSDKLSPSPSKRHSISTFYSPTSSMTWKDNKSPSQRCSSGFGDCGVDSLDGKPAQTTPSRNVASSLPNSSSNSRRGSTALLPSQQSCEVDDDSLAGESSLMTELMQVQQLTVPEDITEEETKSTQRLDYNNNAGILNSRETGQVHHLLPPARQSCEVDDHVSIEDKSLLDEPVIVGYCSMNFHRDVEDEDEAYNSLRSSERKSFSKQLDILQETNKRLCESNDDLRAALEALTGRRSSKLSKARRNGEKCHRNPSIHSDYGSISSRSITPNHLQGPKSEDDVADGAEAEEPGELSGYEPESDVNTVTVNARHFEEAPKLSKLTATPHEFHVALKEHTSDVMWESDPETDPVPAQPTHHQHEHQQQQHLAANVETNASNLTHSPFVRNSLSRKPCRHKSLEQLFNHSNSKGDRSAWPPIARAGKWNSMEQVRRRNDFIGERTRSLPTSRWQSDEKVNLGQGIGLWQLSEKLNVLRASRESVAELKDDFKVNVIAASHEPVIQSFNTENRTIFQEDLGQLVRKPSLRQRIFHDKKITEKPVPEDKSTPTPVDFAEGSNLRRRNSLVIKRNRTKTDSLPESDNSKPDTFSAELEAQFKSVIEEDDEDIDEDDVGDEELAQLVAMARANTESEDDSETEAEAPEEERVPAVGSDSLSEASSNTPLHASVAEINVPERMYKLVLAGDAAVGKSSFILRLCRNRFHSALNSTLGVDFQMKTLVVDDKTIAFQLWDTAGQERFRSIAKSYFRKADGVLLLYDVTCETSFINVRDWVEAIEDSTSKPIPIMLCGNKTDLRQSYIAEGKTVITEENGEKLAREYGALFIETSSKENRNITDACIELGRLLRKIEDTEVEQSHGVTLKEGDEKSKKESCCLT